MAKQSKNTKNTRRSKPAKDDPRQATESGEPKLTGREHGTTNSSQSNASDRRDDDDSWEHYESGRQDAVE